MVRVSHFATRITRAGWPTTSTNSPQRNREQLNATLLEVTLNPTVADLAILPWKSRGWAGTLLPSAPGSPISLSVSRLKQPTCSNRQSILTFVRSSGCFLPDRLRDSGLVVTRAHLPYHDTTAVKSSEDMMVLPCLSSRKFVDGTAYRWTSPPTHTGLISQSSAK